MKLAKVFFILSLATYVVSIILLGAMAYPGSRFLFPFQAWVHILLMILLIGAAIRRLQHSDGFAGQGLFLKTIPRWLIICGIVSALLIAFQMPSALDAFDFGKTAAGEVIHSEHWFEEGGNYFLQINKKNIYPISETKFNNLNREMQRFFCIFWIAFSYVSTVVWNFYTLRCDEPQRGKVAEEL